MTEQEQTLNKKKLNLIKIKLIKIEQESIVRSKTDKEIADEIRKYIEKVVESK
mgnify:CR=1 FL=1